MKFNTKQSSIIYTLLLILTAVIWGTAFVSQSVGADYVGAFTFLSLRSWIAFFFLIPVIFAREKFFEKNNLSVTYKLLPTDERKSLLTGGAVCGFFLFAASYAQQYGIAYTTTAKASFLTTLYVVLVPILSIFLHQKVTKKIWFCTVFFLFGAYLLSFTSKESFAVGDVYVLICAFLFAFQIMCVSYFGKKMDPVRLAWLEFGFCALFATIGMFLFEKVTVASIYAALPAILYAGFLSSGVGYTLQIVSQRHINPSVASIIMCTESVFGAIAGWIILGQTLSIQEIIGCAIMLIATIIAEI